MTTIGIGKNIVVQVHYTCVRVSTIDVCATCGYGIRWRLISMISHMMEVRGSLISPEDN